MKFPTEANVGHFFAGHSLPNFKGLPFITGGYNNENKRHSLTEIVNQYQNAIVWTIIPDYPFNSE